MRDVSPGRFAKFADFEIDLDSGDIRKAGLPIRIQSKPLQVLRLLLKAQGQTVTREELRSALWPENTFVDFEHGLNTAVKKLRKVLEDSAEHPKLIETVPKAGYRFIGIVGWIPDSREGEEPNTAALMTFPDAAVAAPNPRKALVTWSVVGLCSFLVLIPALILFRQYPRLPPGTGQSSGSEVYAREWQLTANPEDTPVTSGAISPDGKLLAYSDPTGLYTKSTDRGEAHPIPVPKGFEPLVEGWFPDGDRLLVSWAEHADAQPSLWEISVFGGTPRRISQYGYSASVSPDGSRIVFVKRAGPGEEIWVMRADGGGEGRLTGSGEDSFTQAAWAPDSNHFAYARTKTRYYASRRAPDTLVEIFDIRSQKSVVVKDVGERGLPRGGAGLAWLPDGRLIFPRREPRPNQQDTNLWSLSIDAKSLTPRGPCLRLTYDKGIAVQLSFGNGGKRMAVRRHAPQPDIYITDLERGSNRLSKFRRLTLDDRLDYAMDWTSDNRAVIFYSNRNGPFHVFKQAIDATQPELLVGGKDDLYAPRLTPDGFGIIYVVRPNAGARSNNSRIMRASLSGGVPQPVLEAPGIFDLECTWAPANFCLYGEVETGRGRLFTFDPTEGKAQELSKVERELDSFDWILSHDGKRLAWASRRVNGSRFGVRVFSTGGKWERDIAVPGWSEISGLDWAADSRSLWACVRDSKGDSALLNITPDQKITTVFSDRYRSLEWAVPSRDGRHLAVVQNGIMSNISLLEDF